MSALDLQGAMAVAKSAPVQAPQSTVDPVVAKKAAKAFEGSFISEFMGQMFESIPTDSEFGGGEGEDMFRSLLTDEYSKQINASGGFGLSAAVTRQLLKTQENPVQPA